MSEKKLDVGLYSRQMLILGEGAQVKIGSANVLISGLNGVGIEISKNIVLAGINSITLHDNKVVTINDLASNYFLNESDIGSVRSLRCVGSLSKLNKYVTIGVIQEDLNEEIIKKFDVFVLTDLNDERKLFEYSEMCHRNNVKFIYAECTGLFSFIFSDGGDHTILSKSSEQPKRFSIKNIKNYGKDSVVSVSKGFKHGLSKSDKVRFEGIECMSELNGKTFRVKIIDEKRFQIADSAKYGEFKNDRNSAIGIPVFSSVKKKFKQFSDAIKKPSYETFDFFNPDSHSMTILLFMARLRMGTEKMSLDDFKSLVKRTNEEYKLATTINEESISIFYNTLGMLISPMCAIIGGFAGQEVLKLVSGKFIPIDQFFAFDFSCIAPNHANYTIKNDRYDPYRVIFGDRQVEKIRSLSYFMVGCGALGCELLKNFATMGLSTSPGSVLHITDLDRIEISNLSRQFLFHPEDVGLMKSDVAARATREFNKEINIKEYTTAACKANEHIFGDSFYRSLDGVATSLDNVPSRIYISTMCAKNYKPMIDSGTLGELAHVAITIPEVTQMYSFFEDNNDGKVAFCTLHFFHKNIDHCTLWACDKFENLFNSDILVYNRLINDPTIFNEFCDEKNSDHNKILLTLVSIIKERPIRTCAEAARVARLLYEDFYLSNIKDILERDPPTSSKWKEEELKVPEPEEFNINDELTRTFILSTVKLYSRVSSFELLSDDEIIKIARESEVPPYVVTHFDQVPLCTPFLGTINEMKEIKTKLKPYNNFAFEKDDDLHADFIYAAANLRARCFNILTESHLEIRRLAGNIQPAMATTTALICGFVTLNMFALHSTEGVYNYRDVNVNLANNSLNIFEPTRSRTFEIGETGKTFTEWTVWKYESPITVRSIINDIQEKSKATIEMLSITYKGSSQIIYGALFNDIKDAKFDKTIEEVVREYNITLEHENELNFVFKEQIQIPMVKYFVN